MRNPLDAVLASLAGGLARAGLIDRRRGDRTVELAWPRILTGVARLSQRVADFAMVGAAIGPAALAYGRDVLRFSFVVFLIVTASVLVLARPIADVFVDGADTLNRTVPFVREAAASAIAFGIDGAATGVLRGSGGTRWPFYGKLVGLYGAALPIAYLAVASPLGIVALYVALIAETAVPACVTYYRFHSGAWLPPSGVDSPAATE